MLPGQEQSTPGRNRRPQTQEVIIHTQHHPIHHIPTTSQLHTHRHTHKSAGKGGRWRESADGGTGRGCGEWAGREQWGQTVRHVFSPCNWGDRFTINFNINPVPSMSKSPHNVSLYVNHSLNLSKSKSAFSFQKSPRFLPDKRYSLPHPATPPISSTSCRPPSAARLPPSGAATRPPSRRRTQLTPPPTASLPSSTPTKRVTPSAPVAKYPLANSVLQQGQLREPRGSRQLPVGSGPQHEEVLHGAEDDSAAAQAQRQLLPHQQRVR